MKEILKRGLFALMLLFLLLPFFQRTFNIFNEKPLEGAFYVPSLPGISFKKWFSGEFQENYSSYINIKIGFRPFLIRLRNQIYFSVFNEYPEAEFVIGKNKNIFGVNNIRSFTGDDFAGADFINSRINKLKLIQDSLTKMGLPVFFIIAPGKANFSVEDIPGKYIKADSLKANYYWINRQVVEKK